MQERLTVFQVRPQWQRKGDRSTLAGNSCVFVCVVSVSEPRLPEDDGVGEPSAEEAPAEPPKEGSVQQSGACFQEVFLMFPCCLEAEAEAAGSMPATRVLSSRQE